MKLLLRPRKVFIALTFCFCLIAALPVNAQLSGAIFTTTSTGATVNGNLYAAKTDVYLNGGPQNTKSAGLPDGTYYFQVTDPNGGVLLSTDPARCRQLIVVGGVVAGATGPCPHPNGALNPANGSTPVQLSPFNDTSNPGGEYKAWLIAQTANTSVATDGITIIFNNSDTKTDNFKVAASQCPNSNNPSCPQQAFTISGIKCYDANLNGVCDPGEAGIPLWQISIGSSNVPGFVPFTTMTDSNGAYSFPDLSAGTYGVCEVLPAGSPTWVPTSATRIFPINVGPDSTNNNFANVCLGAGGGLTLGFWSNKNGQSLITASDLCFLNSLNLRNADGSNFDPIAGCPSPTSSQLGTGKTNLKNWLLGATATNMSYMLSAQLTAMELNVLHGGVTGTAEVFAGTPPAGCTLAGLSSAGFISIKDLMNDANAQLGADGNAVSGDPNRSCQEFTKNTLDSANNNNNFVQATACAVNYAGGEKCSPTP